MGHDIERASASAHLSASYAGSRASSSTSLSATSSNATGSGSGAGGATAASPPSLFYVEDEHEDADSRPRGRTPSNTEAEGHDHFLAVAENALHGNCENGHPATGGSSGTVLHLRQSSIATDATLEPLDDPSTFKLKLRAGLFYLACSTAHELMIYKIAQRTFWQTAAFFLSFEYLLWLVCGAILTIYMRISKSVRLQKIIGVNGTQLLWLSPSSPSFSKDVLPLAALLVATAALRLLKDGLLDVTTSASISSYIAPTLLLLIPSICISAVQATNGFLTLSAIAIPLLFGLTLVDLRVLPIGLISALALVLAEAAKLAFAKKTLSSRGISPLETVLYYLPVTTVLALVTILPLSIYYGAPKYTPHLWPRYFVGQSLIYFLHEISSLIAVKVFNTPVSVALLTIPRGLLVTMINSGFLQAHTTVSHEFFLKILLAMFILTFAIPELRCRIRNFNTDDNHHPSLRLSPPSLPKQTLLEQQQLQQEWPQSLQRISLYISPRGTRYLALTSFIPLLYALILQSSSLHSVAISTSKPLSSLSVPPLSVVAPYTSSPTIDMVISHYDETVQQTRFMIETLKYYPWIKNSKLRIILYMKKGDGNNETIRKAELAFQNAVGADDVIHLKNRGREAGTYLQHILRNYNESVDPAATQLYDGGSGLADYTLFLQPHLAWKYVAHERLWLFRHDEKLQTGYLHFAPYIKLDCGKDMEGNGDFLRLHEVYNIFREELCPPTLQLGAYSSQFIVSKKRILDNSYHKYQAMSDVLESGADHWIHQEGKWWKYHGEPGPENPYFGHAMERAWPTIFGCVDPVLADTCPGESHNVTGCQCFD